MNIIISLTSIPSRILHPSFDIHIKRLLNEQFLSIHKCILSIPKQYKRFNNYSNQSIENKISQLSNQFNHFICHWLDIDYGPASKFLGLYEWLLLNDFYQNNTIYIILDDDRLYHYKTSDIYFNFFQQFKDISVVTGNKYLYFHTFIYKNLNDSIVSYQINKKKYVSGFMSFAINNFSLLSNIYNYSIQILNLYSDSFFHDEGILLNFFHCFNINVFYIQFPFITIINEEMIDALCLLSHSRKLIENEIRKYTLKLGYNYYKLYLRS